MRNILPLILVFFLALETPHFAGEEDVRSQIKQWIQQLGDESFIVRQRAESLLIRSGIQAYSELQRAKQSHDVEIVRRAEYVLSQIEQAFLDLENPETVFWIKQYMHAPNQASRAQIIWFLADATTDLRRGEGLQTLCRLVRFEENAALRLEVAKTLIASPPPTLALRQNWYQHIRDTAQVSGDDELLQTLAQYAKLWCDLDEAGEKQTEALQERVRQVGASTLRLLEHPDNRIQIGSAMDILLRYAVAELQDAAGLTEDRDKTVAAALTVQSKQLQVSEPSATFDLYDMLLSNEHYHVGACLRGRFRLHWAMAHFQKGMETGDIGFRIRSSLMAANVSHYFLDYAAGVAYYDQQIAFLESDEYKETHDPTRQVARAKRNRAHYLAEKAAAEENWEEARQYVLQSLSIPHVPIEDEDTDLAILIHRLRKEHADSDREFLDRTEPVLKQVWQNIVQGFEQSSTERQLEEMASTCNTAAWLLANTDGDYAAAMTLIETTMKTHPDEANYLDTLAHVYFLGENADEAVRIQERVVRMAPEATVFQSTLARFKKAKEEKPQ